MRLAFIGLICFGWEKVQTDDAFIKRKRFPCLI